MPTGYPNEGPLAIAGAWGMFLIVIGGLAYWIFNMGAV